MLTDLRAHYLDLLVGALEALGRACLHVPERDGAGKIYVVGGVKGSTAAEFVVGYVFDQDLFKLAIEFADERAPFAYASPYVAGVDTLWPKLARAVNGNRIGFKPGAKRGLT